MKRVIAVTSSKLNVDPPAGSPPDASFENAGAPKANNQNVVEPMIHGHGLRCKRLFAE
ncbi:hypothetical protein [Agrobacterium leguminum]|uniref:hypothetical protein n=1 Tax=Agrobacterium leguminum TaxID=2792015 RepID=UPI003CE4A263